MNKIEEYRSNTFAASLAVTLAVRTDSEKSTTSFYYRKHVASTMDDKISGGAYSEHLTVRRLKPDERNANSILLGDGSIPSVEVSGDRPSDRKSAVRWFLMNAPGQIRDRGILTK